MIYDNLKRQEKNPVQKLRVSVDYIEGCKVSINAGEGPYKVLFIDKDTGICEYSTELSPNHWGKANKAYFINWLVKIEDLKGNVLFEYSLNLEGKRVFVSIDSNSLGDVLAWLPYVEEFRKKHKCTMVCSTGYRSLFESKYPDIQFVEKGRVENIAAQYNISWYYKGEDLDYNRHPVDPKGQPMQKTASDILGLEYKEIKPKISYPKLEKENTVSLGIHSTAQAKYWNNPEGWQTVVDYVNSKGHTPLLLSKEQDGYMGNSHPANLVQLPESDLNTVISELCKSKVFVGIGSGLSWLAWACDVPVVLISGFSEDFTEMSDCIRIGAPKGKCSGCFNTTKLDSGDWNWCPRLKDTARMFECTKSINPQIVIKELDQFLK